MRSGRHGAKPERAVKGTGGLALVGMDQALRPMLGALGEAALDGGHSRRGGREIDFADARRRRRRRRLGKAFG